MNRIALLGWHTVVRRGLGLLGLLLCLATPALAAVTERVNVGSGGAQANLNSFGSTQSISADGRYVVFISHATNLVPGNTNEQAQAYLHDRLTGITERVSVDGAGRAGSGPVQCGTLVHGVSDDGRYVVFSSFSSNLVSSDTNEAWDIFVRDRLWGTTERVSVSSTGEQGNHHSFYEGAISGDGRYVAFLSGASNLVPGDTNGDGDVFVRDRVSGTTERVSVGSDGGEANEPSNGLAMSADGRYVAFDSYATNLVPEDANGIFVDVYVHDRATGTTELVSVSTTGEQGNLESVRPAISADGRYVLFLSYATNLVPGVREGYAALYLRDRSLGTTEMVSLDNLGQQPEAMVHGGGISADGRFIPFDADDTDLIPAYPDLWRKVCVRDRWAGTTELIAASSDGEPANDTTERYAISADGRYVVFDSLASNLVEGDTNGRGDVFVRDRCNGAPAADFAADVVSLPATWPVTFTDLSADFPSSWSWSFGDGETATMRNPTHVYAASGVYTVSVTVGNEYGSDSDTKAGYLTVGDSVVVAEFAATPERGVVPLAVIFTDASLGAPTSCAWDFGDGATSTEQHPTHHYARAGNYLVTLTVSGAYGTDTQSRPHGVRVTFCDVPFVPRHWALDYILACASAGIVGGYADSSYQPLGPVTRDAMAVFISRALAGGDASVPAGPTSATFTDVPTDHWAFRYIEYAVDQSVTSGYADDTYRPLLTVTRDQMAVFIARAMAGGDSDVPSGPASATFSDVPTDHWAFRYVEYLRDEDVAGGYGDGTYRPLLAVTRDQMAVYVQRAFHLPI